MEHIATLLMQFIKRAAASQGIGRSFRVPLLLTQQQLADGLGLSLVHTNKTFSNLVRRGPHRNADGRLCPHNVKALARLTGLYGHKRAAPRPLIYAESAFTHTRKAHLDERQQSAGIPDTGSGQAPKSCQGFA